MMGLQPQSWCRNKAYVQGIFPYDVWKIYTWQKSHENVRKIAEKSRKIPDILRKCAELAIFPELIPFLIFSENFDLKSILIRQIYRKNTFLVGGSFFLLTIVYISMH